MNAPPVLRPLRAILQRRLQTITSRPVRTPYYVHASNKYRAQLRYNSSNSDQTPKSSEPAENSSSEHAIRSETATTTSPVEDVQATQAQAVGETTSAKVEYVSVPVPEEQEEVAELAIPRLDGLFVKSAFQRLKVADEEIQIGIAEAAPLRILLLSRGLSRLQRHKRLSPSP
ncbi:hypothetical protein BD289DRAFT_130521 [Coniella lustricola]|uniref:Uncharacterized protein n=1 Tax=Coniella lustricola TaxID=2025994 RepID=A0A2T3AFK1_9PEZI|nr:hypothetical protein BD289DRAFT_130521 [Coniella lustricola]